MVCGMNKFAKNNTETNFHNICISQYLDTVFIKHISNTFMSIYLVTLHVETQHNPHLLR